MIYRISNFDEGPHWDTAFIEAETAQQAIAILQELLDRVVVEPDCCPSVRKILPQEEWLVVRIMRPLRFVLGACDRD